MKVVLTEGQMRTLLKEEVIMESLFHKGMSFNEILATVKSLAKNGLLTATLITNIILSFQLNHTQKQLLQQAAQTEQVAPKKDAVAPEKTREEKLANPDGKWRAIANDVTATVYNAVPSQCNNDVKHTASMFKLNLNDVLSHRIIAMERTMMKEYGLKYGDVVKIEGTGKWDGLWRIEDTMNKRFAGQHKIDILVPNNITKGQWQNVVISVPGDEQTKTWAKEAIG